MKQITTNINMVRLAIAQGIFYMGTGIWPILNIESFIAVTGPKTDLWLVKTVGMLIFFIGAGLLTAGLKKRITFSLIVIAAGAAFGFILVDVIYVWKGVISLIYLLDAVAELIILILWIGLVLKKDEPDDYTSPATETTTSEKV